MLEKTPKMKLGQDSRKGGMWLSEERMEDASSDGTVWAMAEL